ncbi:DNA cytosine methyltransferase [Faecalibaculum rodentium]|nr:DNA cytosine methyltransferase [Faecalibaculum rodentium]
MSFPDDLDQPGRTMLTSESTINRSTHVIEDKETGKIRFITPIEAERLQGFPDNWTDTGMPKSKRYFMMGNALVTGVIGKMEPYLAKIINREPEDTND